MMSVVNAPLWEAQTNTGICGMNDTQLDAQNVMWVDNSLNLRNVAD